MNCVSFKIILFFFCFKFTYIQEDYTDLMEQQLVVRIFLLFKICFNANNAGPNFGRCSPKNCVLAVSKTGSQKSYQQREEGEKTFSGDFGCSRRQATFLGYLVGGCFG